MKASDFVHYTEVGNMHTIIGLLLRDAGISFLYRIAVEQELDVYKRQARSRRACRNRASTTAVSA